MANFSSSALCSYVSKTCTSKQNIHTKTSKHCLFTNYTSLLSHCCLIVNHVKQKQKKNLFWGEIYAKTAIIMLEHFVQQEIKYFFQRITAKQWDSLTSGSPDSASKILSAELILTLILIVTESLFKELNSAKDCMPGENVLSLIEDSLLLNLSRALGLGTSNYNLRILLTMIQQLAQENATLFLRRIKRSDINLEITSLSKLKQILDQVIKVFIEIGPETSLLSKKYKKQEEDATKWDKISSGSISLENKLKTSIQSENENQLSDIITSLLVDVPECSIKRIRYESNLELQNISDGPSTLRCFYSKWFLKVWLCSMLQRLNKKYPQHTKAGKLEIVDSIIQGLISAFADVENQDAENVNSLLMIFTKFPCDNVLELTEKLRDLIFQHVLTNQCRESIWERQFKWNWADPKPDSGIDVDIWRNVCVCIVIMNWFHNSQADNMVPQIRDAQEAEWKSNSSEHDSAEQDTLECEDDTELQDLSKVYIRLLVAKAVYHVYNDAKVMARNRDKVIDRIFERIWPEVKGEKIYITNNTFQQFDKVIHRGLCRKNMVVETLHFMDTLDPVVVNFLISLIRERLMTPPGEQHPVKRMFITVGKWLSRPFRRSF